MFHIKDTLTNASSKDVILKPTAAITREGEPHVLNQSFEGFVSGSAGASVQQWSYSSLQQHAHGVLDFIFGTTQAPLSQRRQMPGTDFQATGGWLGMTDKYWATVLVPSQDMTYGASFTRSGDQLPVYQADFARATPITIAAGQSTTLEQRLFAGAKEVHRIWAYDSQGIPKFSYVIDWGWFWFITQPMFYLIDFLYKLVGRFWIAMLLVTVVVKAVFFPIANKSFESMTKMKKLQPEMQKIQERFKDDKVRQQQAIMELYKAQGVNPMVGCIPVLLQIPVFFALYKVLYTTIEMRQAPFVGWIHDLSAPDPTNLFNLFGLLPFDIPAAVPFLHLGAWPIVMGITMWLQMKLNPPPPDPVQARMFTLMPLIFTFMLGTAPAGLVVYWAWNNSLTLLQQSLIMRRQGVKVELFDNLKKTFAEGAELVSGLFRKSAK
jgi:YidC/Oxa1 family membrane protein insertase